MVTHRLEVLLNLRIQGAGLEGDDVRGALRVVGDGAAALGAEDAVDGLARGSDAGPRFGRSLDGELVLGDDGDEG